MCKFSILLSILIGNALKENKTNLTNKGWEIIVMTQEMPLDHRKTVSQILYLSARESHGGQYGHERNDEPKHDSHHCFQGLHHFPNFS